MKLNVTFDYGNINVQVLSEKPSPYMDKKMQPYFSALLNPYIGEMATQGLYDEVSDQIKAKMPLIIFLTKLRVL